MVETSGLSEILREDTKIRPVEPHIYSVYSQVENINSYDRMGGFYDALVRNRVYNRLVWGYRISEYHSVCLKALTSSTDGWVLDAGCGSLAFTARTYLQYSDRPVVLLDQSLKMLKMAKARLIKLNGDVPPNLVFLHGDALELPFKPKSFTTIVSLNLLHVLDDAGKALDGFKKVLSDGGTISFTTLVINNRLADRYLNMFGKMGEVVPRSVDQLLEIFDKAAMPVRHHVNGNLAFISYG